MTVTVTDKLCGNQVYVGTGDGSNVTFKLGVSSPIPKFANTQIFYANGVEISSASGTNYLIRSKLEGSNPTPTGWTNTAAGTSRAIVAPLDGGADGAKAVLFTNASDLANTLSATAVSADANTTYLLSVIVESISITSGVNRARGILANVQPSGSTQTFPVCSANPSGGATGAVQAGTLLVQVAVGSTAGNITMRLALGISSDTCTGTAQLTRPMIEKRSDGVRGTWIATDATAVTLSGYTYTNNALVLGTAPAAGAIITRKLFDSTGRLL